MDKKLKIANCEIDFVELTISRNHQVIKMQSKAMAVLHCLANSPSKLVTNDQIMEFVWPNRVVSLNSLQRCIAQLRQALGDSATSPEIIKTYPTRGYALVAPVEELTEDKSKTVNVSQSSPSSDGKKTRLPWLLAGVMTLFVVAVMTLNFSPEPNLYRAQISTMLTSSKEHTGGGVYSPDSTRILFQRYSNFCESQIWLIDLYSKQEIQLSDSPKFISDASWSTSGEQLLFVEGTPCITPKHNQCWQIQRLDLKQLNNGASVSPVGTCSHQPINQISWLNDHQALILERQNLRKLRVINLKTGDKSTLYDQHDVLSFIQILSNKIVLLTHAGNAELKLVEINTNGQITSETELNFDGQASVFSQGKLLYWPRTEQILLETMGQLFKVDNKGQLSKLIQVEPGMNEFSIAPTTNQLIATKNRKRQNLYVDDWTSETGIAFNYSRDINNQARFSPQNSQIAFVSNRSGINQIWLSEQFGASLKQLTQFDNPVNISGIEWLPSGEYLYAIINDRLYQIDLQGNAEPLSATIKIKYLHQVISNDQLLITYQHDFEEMLALISLNPITIQNLHAGQFITAKLSPDNRLWYIDKNFKLNLTHHSELPELLASQQFSNLRLLGNSIVASTKSQLILSWQSGEDVTQLKSLPGQSHLADVNSEGMVYVQTELPRSDIVKLKLFPAAE